MNIISDYLSHFSFIRKKPSFFILGAQKAGTTALHDILKAHNQVTIPKRKELHLLHKENFDYKKYLINFKVKSNSKITFEATPDYLFLPQAIDNIRDYFYESKIVILLREPAERAFSAWNMFHRINRPGLNDQRSFSEAINIEKRLIEEGGDITENKTLRIFGYIGRSSYYKQLKYCFDTLSSDRIYIIESESLKKNFQYQITELQKFLELEVQDLPLLKSHVGKKYITKDDLQTIKHLRNYLKEDVSNLNNLLKEKYRFDNLNLPLFKR